MTVDPMRGELSRAMRNRGVEVSLMPLHAQSRDVLGLLCAIEADAPPDVSTPEQGLSLEATTPLVHSAVHSTPAATPLAMMAAHARAQVAAVGGASSPSAAQHSATALVQWAELALRRRQLVT